MINLYSSLPSIADSLSKLYLNEANYKLAYYYDKVVDSCKVIIREHRAKDEIVMLQVEMENKKRENDLLEIEKQKNRKYNLQILAISICLATFFSCMMFLGMLKVSKSLIKMTGYFGFISLFEFIVLIIDPFIIRLTNAEPLKIWGIKIFLIAMLVPFQHFLEHGLITFLSGRKLLEVRQRFSIKNFWSNKGKTKPVIQMEIEDDTAIL